MGGTVKFALADVAALVEHARAAPEMSPSLGQMLDPKYQLPSAKGKDMLKLTSEDVDATKLPRGLWLVKDRGCYLMSAGKPGLMVEPDNPANTSNVVVYGKGYGPDDDYDKLRATCGGDDFVESLSLETFEKALASGAETIDVKFTANHLSVSWLPRRAARAG